MCESIRFATLINLNDLMTRTHMVITQRLYWPLQTVMDFNCVGQRKLRCVFLRPVMCNADSFLLQYLHKQPDNLHSGGISA